MQYPSQNSCNTCIYISYTKHNNHFGTEVEWNWLAYIDKNMNEILHPSQNNCYTSVYISYTKFDNYYGTEIA